MYLVELIRLNIGKLLEEEKILFVGGKNYSNTWTDEEIIKNIEYIDCSNSGVSSIPKLPFCKKLVCSNNELQFIPSLSECSELICDNNEIFYFGDISKCKTLICNNNKLIFLPPLPDCEYINCSNNQITAIGQDYPNCKVLICNNNKIFSLPKIMRKCVKLECLGNKIEGRLPMVYKDCVVFHENKKANYINSDDSKQTLFADNIA